MSGAQTSFGVGGGVGEGASRDFYSHDSSGYDAARWKSRGGARTNRVQQSIVASLTREWSGGRVIEVGPGTGRFTIPVARRAGRVTVADLSPGMLATARANIEQAGAAGLIEAYVEASIYELPVATASFDHAISLNVFNHLERPGDALQELARAVKPGGTVLFNYANLRSYFYLAARRINRGGEAVGQRVFSSWITNRAARGLAERAGLRIERVVGHVHMPRAMEGIGAGHAVGLLDSVSRAGPLRGLAPVQFCLCRRIAG